MCEKAFACRCPCLSKGMCVHPTCGLRGESKQSQEAERKIHGQDEHRGAWSTKFQLSSHPDSDEHLRVGGKLPRDNDKRCVYVLVQEWEREKRAPQASALICEVGERGKDRHLVAQSDTVWCYFQLAGRSLWLKTVWMLVHSWSMCGAVTIQKIYKNTPSSYVFLLFSHKNE